MLKKLVLATSNLGKVKELKELLQPLSLEIYSLRDFPGLKLPPETGRTFEENAILKARFVSSFTGLAALGDDSGLEVEALGGAPGVYSSRFAGEGATDAQNNEKLLGLLKGYPQEKRRARFRCVLALCTPEGDIYTGEGSLEGVIATEPRGTHGFGYDPVFLLPEAGKTLAELDLKLKNTLSHRARALRAIWPALLRVFGRSEPGYG
ncbi:MAG: XTP/dITP diphosphatase [Thermanaeromonas sp.]|uniref:XTP/dITP diphosphatase n=1 Tax=Thermanaeromonas sp. TaxID=2003697 RepID=UPI00243C72E6|nr:XTP/dITP diphosphatase [Thermanaeromonas sp.]MCG0278887.1 XTP/dITP diphosphatase [Thermanaeromonas sp.]